MKKTGDCFYIEFRCATIKLRGEDMKKIFSFMLLIFLVFSCAGCGDSLFDIFNSSNSSDTSESSENAKLKQEINRLNKQLEALKNDEITYADIMESLNETSLEYIKSNVKIVTTGYIGVGIFQTPVTGGQGSGVIFAENNDCFYCLTNNHVTNIDSQCTSKKYTITDYKGYSYNGSLICSSADYDLAVLRFSKRSDSSLELKPLNIQKTNPVVGDFVIAIGQPEGQNNTITIGNVVKYENVTLEDSTDVSNVKFEVICHDAPINHGSSGGVLINLKGEIVGINYAGSVDENGDFLAGYAIPIEKVIEYLTANGFTLS